MINRIVLLGIAASAIFLNSCDSKPATPQKPPPIAISVFTVQEGDATYYHQYPATVAALNQVDIRSEVSGYVTGIYFKDGQYVTKGMKLYTIDQQQYKANYDQSVANLNVARANLGKAQQDADRYTELAQKDAIARQVLDHALADLQTAKMQVAAAQANVRNVETGLKYSTIYSPLSGTIGISQVKNGSSVAPGTTVLNTVSTDDPIAVDVQVDEKQIPYFRTLQQKGTALSDSVFQLVLPDQSMFPYDGSIYLIDRAVDPQTGTIRARLSFPNPQRMLRPGMTCNLKIKGASGSATQILIPYKAVLEQMGEYFVYVVNGNTVSQRKVNLGQQINEKVIVNSGLQAGEVIATEGVQKLKDGSQVRVPGSRQGVQPNGQQQQNTSK